MAELQEIGQLLQQSLHPTERKAAEEALRQREAQPGFSILLLHVVASQDLDQALRLAAALYFKNFIKRSWTTEEGDYKLPQNEVITIKQEIIGLMTSVPPKIQNQLGDAISVIADSDFWQRWDTLVDDLVSRLTPDNTEVNIGVLQVAHSIFKRWRPLFRSDELYTEINHVLEKFAAPFLQLLQHTDQVVDSQANDKAALAKSANLLSLEMKLFYDLSCQDMPPQFEENIAAISTLLQKYVTYNSPALQTSDDTESGPLEYIKAGIFEILTLYTQKFEEFSPYVQEHVTSCWNFLTNVGSETKYDILVSRALQFLTAVASNQHHAQIFASEATITEIVQRVILPNVTLRESDLELFEDEPIEFIRRDLEGSDNDTRRRAATDLLRELVNRHEQLVTTVVLNQVKAHLDEYAKNPQEKWQHKDTAIYLYCAVAAKGNATVGQGIRAVNQHVNIMEFFQSNVASDLTNATPHPLLTVDAIKFLYIFRSILGKDLWQAAFPPLVQHLNSSQYVVYTYAAIAVERVLSLVGDDGQPVIPRDEVNRLANDLLRHLFTIIQKDSDPRKIQENEFLMRCVMRVLIVIKDGVVPITDLVMRNFINITMVIRHNPSNPKFYYYHFEGIGALIRFAAPSQPEKLETAFYEVFATILQTNVAEFTPYVFQLFAALLEANPSGTLSAYYQGLIGPILQPAAWESKGNIPALVRLLSAMIARGSNIIVQNNQVEPILGVFQKLISSKVNEVHGFDLVDAIIAGIPAEAVKPYFLPLLQIMMTRLSSSKTDAFAKRFAGFYHICAARDDKGLGTDYFVSVCDQVQNDVFRPVYTSVILPETQKLSKPSEKKTAAIGLTKSLATSESFATRYPKGWPLTCTTVIGLLTGAIAGPSQASAADQMIDAADPDDVSFGVGFTQLNTCRKPVQDPFPEIRDVKAWVAQYLKQADAAQGGKIGQFVRERLTANPDIQQAFGQLLS